MDYTVYSIYGVELPDMEEPAQFVFAGELRIPGPHEWFYSKAKEAVMLRPGMRVSSPRLILLPTSATVHYPPIAPNTLDKLRSAYQSGIHINNTSRMFNVTKRTVAAYFQKFEMDDYRAELSLKRINK